MIHHLPNLSGLRQPQPGPAGRPSPHKLADNDNDYPPALPIRVAAAVPLPIFGTAADGLLT